MPVFEYRCRQCGQRFEYLVLRTSAPPECPACREHDLEQLVSLCAVSSEATRHAHLTAAHARAAAARHEKHRQEHASLHQHFEDAPEHPADPKPH